MCSLRCWCRWCGCDHRGFTGSQGHGGDHTGEPRRQHFPLHIQPCTGRTSCYLCNICWPANTQKSFYCAHLRGWDLTTQHACYMIYLIKCNYFYTHPSSPPCFIKWTFLHSTQTYLTAHSLLISVLCYLSLTIIVPSCQSLVVCIITKVRNVVWMMDVFPERDLMMDEFLEICVCWLCDAAWVSRLERGFWVPPEVFSAPGVRYKNIYTHTHILKVLLYFLSPVCHSSSSEQRASRLPGSDNPSVYSHAALWKVQESAPPNAAQTQASKSVRPAGVRHMSAQAWSLSFPPSYVPLGFPQIIPDRFCLSLVHPWPCLSICLSLSLFSLFNPSGLKTLFPLAFWHVPVLGHLWQQNLPYSLQQGGIGMYAGVCERLETDKHPICCGFVFNPAEWKPDDHLYTRTIFSCMTVQLGWIWYFNSVILANSKN